MLIAFTSLSVTPQQTHSSYNGKHAVLVCMNPSARESSYNKIHIFFFFFLPPSEFTLGYAFVYICGDLWHRVVINQLGYGKGFKICSLFFPALFLHAFYLIFSFFFLTQDFNAKCAME